MSRKSFEKNPRGFLKTFCSRSHNLLQKGKQLGFPYIREETDLYECSDYELLLLSQEFRENLIDLQRWLVKVYEKERSEEIVHLSTGVDTLCECYRIKRF